MADDLQLLHRLRDLRKRRGKYRSSAASARELARLRSLLPLNSVEREVFDRVEVGGASYKEIAAALNVSERHLYRVRSRMIEMLEAAENEYSARERLMQSGPSELVTTLLKYGHTKRASDVVHRHDRIELGARERLELLLAQSQIARNQGDLNRSVRCVATARLLARNMIGDERDHAERRIAIAEAYMTYYEGSYELTIAKCENALAPFLARQIEPGEIRSVVRDVTFLAIVHQEGSSPHRALELLDVAERWLCRSPEPSAAELAAICVHRAFAWSSIPGGLAAAEANARRAIEVAASHGLCYEEVWGRLASGVVHYVAGRANEALSDALHALDLGRALLSGDPLARTHFISSRVEIFAGELGETLDHLAETGDLVRPDSFMATIGHLVEARVHQARGDAPSTIASATEAIDGFARRTSGTHYLGGAYLMRGLAGSRLGLDVRDDAERALVLLERGGFIPDQERARALLSHRGSAAARA